MKFKAEITVMPLKELLDPQGKAVLHGLHNLSFDKIEDVRVGKHIHIEVDAASIEEANTIVEEACKKLLTNPVMESYTYSVEELVNV